VAAVYVTRRLPPEITDRLEGRDLGMWDSDDPVAHDVLMEAISDCSGLLCMLTDPIDDALLERAPRLKVVSQMAVGVDNIDIEACRRRGVAVGHTPDVLTNTVADHAFALLAAIVRRLPEGITEVVRGEWGPWKPFHLVGGDLWGTTLGIVGMGRIGQAVARRASGFDMDVVYSSPRPAQVGGRHVRLDDLLAVSDHVVLCASLNDSTTGLIDRRELGLMKRTSYLVNVARGPLVVTDALVEALESGEIAGAALDVTDPEPLSPDHPLVRAPNCLVVPHIASASVRTRLAMADLAVDNLLAGLDDRELPSPYRPWS
jgi:lactate dehydrogenase-like 2-hydroxyacid dehydrogenase